MDLNPCKDCGCTDILWNVYGDDEYCYYCSKCQIEGPSHVVKETAMLYWNQDNKNLELNKPDSGLKIKHAKHHFCEKCHEHQIHLYTWVDVETKILTREFKCGSCKDATEPEAIHNFFEDSTSTSLEHVHLKLNFIIQKLGLL